MGRDPWDQVDGLRSRLMDQLFSPLVLRELERAARMHQAFGLDKHMEATLSMIERAHDALGPHVHVARELERATQMRDVLGKEMKAALSAIGHAHDAFGAPAVTWASQAGTCFARMRESLNAFEPYLKLDPNENTHSLIKQLTAGAQGISEFVSAAEALKTHGAAVEELQRLAAEAARVSAWEPREDFATAPAPVWVPPAAALLGAGRQAELEEQLEDCIEEVRELREQVALSHLREALRCLKAGDHESAEPAARILVKQLPGQAAPLLLLGRVLNGQGKHAEACAAFEEAQRIDPDCFTGQDDYWSVYEASLKGWRWEPQGNSLVSES